jgi:hypothetical protein
MPLMQRMLTGADHPEGVDLYGRAWLSETFLADTAYDAPDAREKLTDLQEAMLPLLVNGFADSLSSIGRHVWYAAITTAVVNPTTSPASIDSDLQDLYWTSRVKELSDMQSAAPSAARDIGMIPMPVSPIRRGSNKNI